MLSCYQQEGFDFLLKVFNSPNYLEDLTGLSQLYAATQDDQVRFNLIPKLFPKKKQWSGNETCSCVLSGRAPTPAGTLTFIMGKIFTHTQWVKLKYDGIWWDIHGLNGWGIYDSHGWDSYSKVSYCFWEICYSCSMVLGIYGSKQTESEDVAREYGLFTTAINPWPPVVQLLYIPSDWSFVVNPRRACAARVTVVGLCVCVCVCYSTSHFLRVYSCHKRY